VVTAVYILRVVGVLLLGPITNDHYNHLGDAKWYERLSVGTLIVAIAGIGIAPLWLSNLIYSGLGPYVVRLTQSIAGF
jgi:NADH-quinone oxidoreductase subunit M